jgi:hypothetical protein
MNSFGLRGKKNRRWVWTNCFVVEDSAMMDIPLIDWLGECDTRDHNLRSQ